jgi:hypothetical protein
VATERRLGSKDLVRAFRLPFPGVATALVVGGAASLVRGLDATWDLRNYHFYNPWAWLNNRLHFDLAPAQIQTYINPLLDLPFYALVRVRAPSLVIAFLMGLPFGLAAYFFLRISDRVTVDLRIRRRGFTLTAIALVALTGAAGFSQIGLTMNEWTTTSLVMAALLLLVRETRGDEALKPSLSLLAGVLVGAAAGCKLNAATYVGSVCLTFIICFRRRRGYLAGVLTLVGGVLIGFAITYGYWGAVLWERFHSPVYPFFNAVFGSEYWELNNFADSNFRRTPMQLILLPFQLASEGRVASETAQRDPRLAVLLVLVGLMGVTLTRRTTRSSLGQERAEGMVWTPSVVLLAVFALTSYLIWLVVFRIYRYAIPIELVAGLLIVLSLRFVFGGMRHSHLAAIAVIGGIIATTVYPDWGRTPLHSGLYFDVKVPSVPADALVLILSREPLAYLLPFLDSHPQVVRPVSNFTGSTHHNKLELEIDALIADHLGPIYEIRYLDGADPFEEQALASHGLRRVDGGCQLIDSTLEAHRALGICRLSRDNRSPTRGRSSAGAQHGVRVRSTSGASRP